MSYLPFSRLFVNLFLTVIIVFPLSTASATSGDLLNLASGPDATVQAGLATEAEKSLYTELLNSMDFLNDPTDGAKFKEGLKKLDNFINEHQEYSDAYLLRASSLYNIARSKEYTSILEDIDNAIKYHPKTEKSAYENTAGMYGLRAKVNKDNGNLQQAIKDLETAININHHDAIDHSGTNPEDTPENGQWGKRDFDEIIKKYPKDYRGYLFRAVFYFNFGILLKPGDYQSAIDDLKMAIRLNPKCEKAYYLLGAIMDQQLVFGKKNEKAYRKEASVRLKGLSIWNAYPEICKKIENAYSNAIKANPRMKEAYLSRAELYLNTQKYTLAIKDFDKVIELDPDYGGAFHDRGLAYSNIGKYWKAIDDFTHSIDAKKKVFSQYQAYINRAKAYADNNQFAEAINDYSKAIELHTAEVIILMSLSEFRTIYPEYNDLDDNLLLIKLRNKYFPNMELEGFSKLLLREDNNWHDTSGFEIYENRGDTYLRFGYYSKAIDDYNRASRIWPDFQIDRWKYVFATSKAKCYLDITTAEKDKNIYKFWLRNDNLNPKKKAESYNIQSMAIDCSSKQLSTLSYIDYDAKGNVMHSYDSFSEWSTIIPDTIGETLYKGWCNN